MIDLNNGSLSPSLRIVTKALVPARRSPIYRQEGLIALNKKNRRASCARRPLFQIVCLMPIRENRTSAGQLPLSA
jgi:hypothetical protein